MIRVQKGRRLQFVRRMTKRQPLPASSGLRLGSWLTLAIIAALISAAQVHSGRGSAGCGPALGLSKARSWPSPCWRPYSASSPFNRLVPADPPLLSNSAAIVRRLVDWGEVQQMVVGNSRTGTDWHRPIYYGRRSQRRYKVKCVRWERACEVHGARVWIPGRAKPSSGGDGHLAVIDRAKGIEYDFWQVRSKPRRGGVLRVSHGGKTRIDGRGLGSNATAAHFGLAGGLIRGPEVLSGEINHALFAAVRCSSGGAVYPAAPDTSGATCSNFGLTKRGAPPLGARLWLAMSDSQIAGLDVPAWKRTILEAMARYGALVGDTINGNSSWGIAPESGASYTSFGVRDPWRTVAERAGVRRDREGYFLDVDSGVDWARYLKVLDPCVSRGDCKR